MHIRAATTALFAAAIILAPPRAEAYLTLTYDNPVINLQQGSSTVEITATLSLLPGGALSFATNAQGFQLPDALIGYSAWQQQVNGLLENCTSFLDCTPLYPLFFSSTFTLNPLAVSNIALTVGSSVDLDLATLAIRPTLAPGIYTTHIGIETCARLWTGAECLSALDTDPFSPPSFDPGPLTIIVSAVPEPPTIALFATALVGLGWLNRRHA